MTDEITAINAAMKIWRQGDFFLAEDLFFIHLANLACPLTNEATELAAERTKSSESLEIEGVASAVIGYVVITQACDIARDCRTRSYIELCPLVPVPEPVLNEIRLLRRPAFALVPGSVPDKLVADLDRVITVEKAFMSHFEPTPGCRNDSERRAFADALARHKIRPAFPDDFNICMEPVRNHLKKIHRSTDAEGCLIQSMGEIRVTASPNWEADKISIHLWFILLPHVESPPADPSSYIEKWIALFGQSDRYSLEAVICRLQDMKASDYVGGERLDLDNLSVT
jgi:hypothetical protein